MSFSVFIKIFFIPSKIEPSPFSMIKNKSCSKSVIFIVVEFQLKVISGMAVPFGRPFPPLAPSFLALIFRILLLNRFIAVYIDY
jgi:hypothetical protein